MDINIRVKLDAPTGWQRRVLLYVVTPVALVAATAAVARATLDTTWIADGKPVSSSKLQSNLTELDTRLKTVEGFQSRATGNGSYSVGAVFCGATAATDGKITNGYAGAKTLCQAACANAPSAHMCTSEELVRTQQRGVLITQAAGWYARGVHSTNGSGPVRDCQGWTNNAGTDLASAWETPLGPVGVAVCSSSFPVLCCD
jgi:hypothetical protein